MKKDVKTMNAVAERCNKYCRGDYSSFSNSSLEKSISCGNCIHYTPHQVCDINLYAEIVNNHDL